MGVVDVVVVVLLVVALVAGLRTGLFSALGMLLGLIVGALTAPWVLPAVAGWVTDDAWRGPAVVAGAVVLLGLGAAIGSAIGGLLRRGADRLYLRIPERLAGGLLGLAAGTLAVMLAATGIVTAGVPQVSAAVASSPVLRGIEQITPDPVDRAMGRVQSAVLGIGVPTIDGLFDDADLADAPDVDASMLDTPELTVAAQSVARISGAAHECGTFPSGSGFVVAEDRIVTNAHVVAGVDSPVVELPGEPARDGHVVYFDPADDVAVIAAEVDASPLPLDDSLEPGDAGAVQGYPYGGPLHTAPAGVIRTEPRLVEGLDGGAASQRFVHTLEVEVAPGNSGGPLLTERGAVAGMVFARDDSRTDIGYAMTTAELLPVIAQVEDGADEAVATGRCAG